MFGPFENACRLAHSIIDALRHGVPPRIEANTDQVSALRHVQVKMFRPSVFDLPEVFSCQAKKARKHTRVLPLMLDLVR